MAKLGLVTIRYGSEVNGGAEYHCRMLSERFSTLGHDVDVLSTQIKKPFCPEHDYPTGTEELNGVTIHRFASIPYDGEKTKTIEKKSRLARKIRRTIYRLGLSKLFFSIWPVWHFKASEEYELMRHHLFYSSDLLAYLEEHEKDYDVLFFFTYENPLTQLGGLIAPQKTIIIPTAHMEGMLFRSINSILFSRVHLIAFNTETERDMCIDIFQHGLANNDVIGVGVETIPTLDGKTVLNKFNIQTPYLLYCGRITPVKINNFITYFKRFIATHNIAIALVLTGDILMDKEISDYIIYTGFISEEEKSTLMQNSLAIANPSTAESLSLLTLEALTLGKPVIGNSKSDVMVEHARKSHGAVQCYSSYKDFSRIVLQLVSNTNITNNIRDKAQEYVAKSYNWNMIMSKFEAIIKNIINKETPCLPLVMMLNVIF